MHVHTGYTCTYATIYNIYIYTHTHASTYVYSTYTHLQWYGPWRYRCKMQTCRHAAYIQTDPSFRWHKPEPLTVNLKVANVRAWVISHVVPNFGDLSCRPWLWAPSKEYYRKHAKKPLFYSFRLCFVLKTIPWNRSRRLHGHIDMGRVSVTGRLSRIALLSDGFGYQGLQVESFGVWMYTP